MFKIESWLHGLLAAFIGGGAGAVTAGFSANLIDPKNFNLNDHMGNFFSLMGTCFLINGFMSMMLYLRQSPLPDVQTIVTGSHTVTTTDAVIVSNKPVDPPTPAEPKTS